VRRFIAGAFLLALAGTACGRGASDGALTRFNKTGFISQVATKSVAQKTARISVTERFTGSDGSDNSITGQGAVDMTKKVMNLTMSVPAESGFSGSVQMVLAGDVAYTKIPSGLQKEIGISKPWLGVKISKAEAASPLGGANLTDPGSILDALRSLASNVTQVGSDTVRGVRTTKYKVDLDVSKLAASAPAFEREMLADLTFNYVYVYVDHNDLVRREEFSADLDRSTLWNQIDIYDYGAPVAVSVPPRAQVEFKTEEQLMSAG
jgi:hypothetical protein